MKWTLTAGDGIDSKLPNYNMTSPNPAEHLVGQVVLGEWMVEEMVDLKENDSTGGFFCIPYRIRNVNTGQRAFLKLLDVIKAIQRYTNEGLGVAQTLSRIGNAHLFETQLMHDCKSLKKIVRIITHGEISLDVVPIGTIAFPFLIFELGDGDTHKFIQTSKSLDHAWWFSTLHQASIGIKQLHGIDVSHQDLKPSNVVFFGVDTAKIADLGRAVRKGVVSPNNDRAGDSRYWPPEYFYGHVSSEWGERFLALDLYLLGSLAFSGFSSIPMTTALFHFTPTGLRSGTFKGNYTEVIPALTRALADTLAQIRPSVPEKLQESFIQLVGQLCHPDPAQRGHPKNHQVKHGQKFSLERYISIFHRLALTARNPLMK